MAEARFPTRVVIAGTGKMAGNIGLDWLVHGACVTWLSRSAARAAVAGPELCKLVRRRMRVDPEFDGLERAALGCLSPEGMVEGHEALSGDARTGALAAWSAAPPDIVIECSAEDPGVKRELGARLIALGGPESLFLSNSSSVPPETLGPRWLGCHWFYPVELHRVVELVLPPPGPGEAAVISRRDAARRALEALGFHCLVQSAGQAFAVNRLLLPLQVLALDCLRQGWPAPVVDELSASCWLPVRILSGMDAIGLDLIRQAVGNYLDGPELPRRERLLPLLPGLDALIAQGKRGSRNRDGLLLGGPLPWPVDPVLATDGQRRRLLGQDFADLAERTIREALGRGDFTRGELGLALDELWGGRLP